jgi:RNA polymerase sigma factor (sigma-70 family)
VGGTSGQGHKPLKESLTSEELVALACDGDSEAWAEIVRRFEGLVWSVANRYSVRSADASDVAQTVWLRLAQYLGRLRNPSGIKAWLVTTTRNECFRVSKLSSRTVPVDATDVRVLADSAVAFDDLARIEDIEQSHALWEAFLRLPERCQSLLNLLNTDPPTAYVEVAERCGIPIGTISTRRRKCLSSLREALQNNSAVGFRGVA